MKKILAFLLIPAYSFGQPTNTCTIRGVVTYFFNKYQGDKPDIGSEVYILDTAKTKKFDERIVDSFHYANFYRSIASSYKSMSHEVPENVKSKIAEYHADDEQYFKGLDGRNYSQYLIVKSSEENYSTTVDASGNYNVNLRPGTYYVFIKSHNRQGISISEISGKMFYKKVRIKADQSLNVSNNFELR